jgi:hypothetical protein
MVQFNAKTKINYMLELTIQKFNKTSQNQQRKEGTQYVYYALSVVIHKKSPRDGEYEVAKKKTLEDKKEW